MRVSLDRVTRPRAHGVLVELSWAGARMRPALLTGSRTANRNRVPHILSAETPGLGTSWHPMTGMPIASLGWAARSSLQLVEVEDCAGTARDGASDDGHALCGQFCAGLGLDGRSQAVGLGQARLHGGEFVGVQGLVGAHCDGVPPWAGLGHPRRRAAVWVSGNCQEGLLDRCRRPSSGDHGALDDNRQAPCCPSGGRLAEDPTSRCAPLSQCVELGNAAGIQKCGQPPSTVAACDGAVVRTWYRLDRNCSPDRRCSTRTMPASVS